MRMLCIAAMCLLGACSMVAPAGFVPVTSLHGRDFEALSATGDIFTITRYDSPEEANTEFWVTAIKRKLIETRGYELITEQAVSAKSGARGHELWLQAPSNLGDQRYFLTVFVEERWGTNYVHVIEAAGPTPDLEPKLSSLREAAAQNF